MKKNKFLFVLLLLVTITLVAFGSTFLYVQLNNEDMNNDSSIIVMTSCNPVYVATLNVVGDCDGIIVENLSQPTTGCLHDYTLETRDMKRLSKADVLVINGGGMEGYLSDVISAYPDLKILDASEGLEAGLSPSSEAYELIEENSHYWLSKDFYEMEVESIARGLGEISPDDSERFLENARNYKEALDSEIGDSFREAEAILAGGNVVLLHEAFEYVALELGCEVVGLIDMDEASEDGGPSSSEVRDFIDAINENSVSLVLADYETGSQMAALIESETHAKVVYLETLIHGSYEKDDYSLIMKENYKKIVDSLK